jgi:predicted transcriptional regulator
MKKLVNLKELLISQHQHLEPININQCATKLDINWRTAKAYLEELTKLKICVIQKKGVFYYYDRELEFKANEHLYKIEHLNKDELIHQYNKLFEHYKESCVYWKQYIQEVFE